MKYLTLRHVMEIEKFLGYTFNNEDLLEQAFIRRSYTEENPWVEGNNEVLEFIGDKVLDLIIVKLLMKSYCLSNDDQYKEYEDIATHHFFLTKYDEGKFSEIKSNLVQKKSLARMMDKMEFQKYLIMGRGDARKKVNEEDSVKEDLFEAIIGALAIDCEWNLDILENAVRKMMDFDLCFGTLEGDNSNLNKLRTELKKLGYNVTSVDFEKNNDLIECIIKTDVVSYEFRGKGLTKRIAEEEAANKASSMFGMNKFFQRREAITDISKDTAINKLQELYQHHLLNKVSYEFEEIKNEDGSYSWKAICECKVEKLLTTAIASSKLSAKKEAAWEMLNLVLGYTEDEHNLLYFGRRK